ncbi:MAG: AmmeMemoRadiSam system protein B [Anaerolineales bacterium]|nr:MAG: AmmeMemoRadiSam system protein B [Anaerolineales bacterium]
MNPKLRPVEVRPFVDQGRPVFMLRDPLALSDKVAILPQELGPLLAFLDGTRDVDGLHASLLVRVGLRITPEIIQRVVDHLDDALLLENDRFAQAYTEAVNAYRSAPFRSPKLAGPGYPADPAALHRLFEDYQTSVSVNGASPDSSALPAVDRTAHTSLESSALEERQAEIVGLISPHIDYGRGGPVYARVWQRAADAIRAADLVIIFGTDHAGSEGRITLTRQHYATPFGTLPTDTDLVDAIAAAIGEQAAFDEEIHHRGEHSIELAAVWLHHTRGGQPCQVVPILCGSFQHFVAGRADPTVDPTLNATLDTLRNAAVGRRTVVVAAADLAHVGPAFADPFPIDRVRYAQLQAADEMLIQTLAEADANAFFRMIAAERDRRNICGLPPVYLTLRLLGDTTRGELTGYDRCPADGANTSFVSICGMVFRNQEVSG